MTEQSHASATEALDNAKLSKMHWKIWFLSAMGIFLDGFDLFIIAIALPLIIHQFHPSPALQGLIVSAAPLGCIIGSSVFGSLTDKLGRRALLLVDLIFFVVFAGLTALSWSVVSLITFRFLLGIGIGADYPVASTYITENMPKKLRGRMLVSGFGFQALGALAGAGMGALILFFYPEVHAWRIMLCIAIIPAVIILCFRLTLPESTRWLINKGEHEKASEIANKMTGKQIKIQAFQAAEKASFLDLFTPRYIKRTILTAGTWFIMDIAFYGIGFFTPVILGAMAFSHMGSDFIAKDIASIHGAAFLDIFLVLGVIIATFLVDSWGRIKLQSLGFIGMSVGLFLLAASGLFALHSTSVLILFIGFIVFNITVNMGPNPITFLLPAEVFPTHLRATGHGFAAACGKVGAALGGFMIPFLRAEIGLSQTVFIIAVTCIAGFLITAFLGYEMKGKSLDELSGVQKNMTKAEVNLGNIRADVKRLTTDLTALETSLTKAISQMNKNYKPDFKE